MANNKKSFTLSILFHFILLTVLIMGFDFTATMPVLENTANHDIISAVVLGDSPKSKVLPKEPFTPASPPPTPASLPKKEVVDTKPPIKTEVKIKPTPVKKNDIALKKALQKKQQELFAKELLADVKKQNEKQKKIKQKQLKSQFANALREQTEKSMRQQLLNEEIKLQGKQTRQSQGIVNKYKALILQAISEQWIVPPGAKKSLYCQLLIRLSPGGAVLQVQISKSSGDAALDSSARAAVLKASPLPVPADAAEFSAFREFVLKVKPENILT